MIIYTYYMVTLCHYSGDIASYFPISLVDNISFTSRCFRDPLCVFGVLSLRCVLVWVCLFSMRVLNLGIGDIHHF
jgi:hypothetical protein